MDWVKIMCNILDHRKIKMIRKGPEGNTVVLLWLLMLIEAGKCTRGGYLMVSDSLPYTAETLSMVTDIPLPTVQLGLATFVGLDMIDEQDGAIYVKNWGKYQSQAKFEERREKDRERKQRQRQKEREKILALEMSRDSHSGQSRDVTPQNRKDKSRSETTTDDVRLLLCETALAKISNQELQGLVKRHGPDRLLLAADVAAETWRRNRSELSNPGGYLQSFCSSLVVPDWFVPREERKARAETLQQRKAEADAEEIERRAQEDALNAARNALWEALTEEKQEMYLTAAKGDLPDGLMLSKALLAKARLLAWDADHSSSLIP